MIRYIFLVLAMIYGGRAVAITLRCVHNGLPEPVAYYYFVGEGESAKDPILVPGLSGSGEGWSAPVQLNEAELGWKIPQHAWTCYSGATHPFGERPHAGSIRIEFSGPSGKRYAYFMFFAEAYSPDNPELAQMTNALLLTEAETSEASLMQPIEIYWTNKVFRTAALRETCSVDLVIRPDGVGDGGKKKVFISFELCKNQD